MKKKLKKLSVKLSTLARIVNMQQLMIDEKILEEDDVYKFIDEQLLKLSSELTNKGK